MGAAVAVIGHGEGAGHRSQRFPCLSAVGRDRLEVGKPPHVARPLRREHLVLCRVRLGRAHAHLKRILTRHRHHDRARRPGHSRGRVGHGGAAEGVAGGDGDVVGGRVGARGVDRARRRREEGVGEGVDLGVDVEATAVVYICHGEKVPAAIATPPSHSTAGRDTDLDERVGRCDELIDLGACAAAKSPRQKCRPPMANASQPLAPLVAMTGTQRKSWTSRCTRRSWS